MEYIFDGTKHLDKEVDFDITVSEKAKTLEGLPEIINADLDIRSKHIKTLKGCPRKVSKLNLIGVELDSLEGCPDEVNKVFIFKSEIKSFKGLGKNIKEIHISDSEIDLNGFPKFFNGNLIIEKSDFDNLGSIEEIDGKLELNFCNGLKNLIPLKRVSELYISECLNLTSLKSVEKVDELNVTSSYKLKDLGNLKEAKKVLLENLKLNSLKGLPKEVDEIYINDVGITTLEGLPEKVNSDLEVKSFSTSSEKIKSLKGCPKEVGGNFEIKGQFETLEGGPEKVGGKYILNDCYKLKSLKGMGEVEEVDINNCFSLPNFEGIYSGVKSVSAIRCPFLKSLKGLPKVLDEFYGSVIAIETLEGGPEKVEVFTLDDVTNLKSLKGCPKEVKEFVIKNAYPLDVFDCIPEKAEKIKIMSCNEIKDITDDVKMKIILGKFDFITNVKVISYFLKKYKSKIKALTKFLGEKDILNVVKNGTFNKIMKIFFKKV